MLSYVLQQHTFRVTMISTTSSVNRILVDSHRRVSC